MRNVLLAAVLALVCAGCHPDMLKEAATEPLASGKTPPQQAVSAAPDVISNPFDINAWADLIEALVVMGVAGFGVKEWRKFRRNGVLPVISSTTSSESPE